MAEQFIREATATDAAVAKTGPGRVKIVLITPGTGSSGLYESSVLEAAAADKVFPRGTQMHINHDSASERRDRPEGNLRNMAAVLLEDGKYEGGELVAEALVASAWRPFVEEFKDFIGTSIVASAQVSEKTIDGKITRVVEKLLPNPFNRVDFVTVAGRGGRIAEVLESAQAIEHRSLAPDAVEASSNDTRAALSSAVKDAHGGEKLWPYVLDFDESLVWFELDSPDESKLWQQPYTLADDAVTLTGDPIEVRRQTSYVPVAPPATEAHIVEATPGQTATNPTGGNTMAEVTIESGRLELLEESHGRVGTLVTERDTANTRAEVAERRAAVAESTVRARDFAAKLVREANSELSDSVVGRIVTEATKDIPLTDDLRLDTDTLTESVTAAREAEESYLASIAQENGLGSVRGVGASEGESEPTITAESAREAILRNAGLK